jgi:hypothetical protein
MAKIPKNYLSIISKSKIFWHFLKKYIAWIFDQLCKISKDFGHYFNDPKNFNF